MFGIRKRFLGLGIFLILMPIIWFVLKDVITLETIHMKQSLLKAYVAEHHILSVLIFGGIYTVSAALAFPLGGIFVLLAGFLFGAFIGTVVTVLAATLGGVIIFLLTRYFFKDWVEKHYGKYLAPIEKELAEHPASYLLFLRFMPVVPYLVINVVPALVNVRFSTFLWTSIVGLLPGAFIFALAGKELSRIASTGDVLTPSLIISLLLLAGLSLVPPVYRKYAAYKKKQ
ncbi:MAG: TVP38/TMEM64 family protein [Patescibacteria group bacterium UBA2103]